MDVGPPAPPVRDDSTVATTVGKSPHDLVVPEGLWAGLVEVKTQDAWLICSHRTCVELHRADGEPSGVNRTDADYWCEVFTDEEGRAMHVLIQPVDHVRMVAEWVEANFPDIEDSSGFRVGLMGQKRNAYCLCFSPRLYWDERVGA